MEPDHDIRIRAGSQEGQGGERHQQRGQGLAGHVVMEMGSSLFPDQGN